MFLMVGRYVPVPVTSSREATPEQILRVIAQHYREERGRSVLSEDDWDVVFEMSKSVDVISLLQDRIDELVKEEEDEGPANQLLFRDPYTGDIYPSPAGGAMLTWTLPDNMLANGHSADGSVMAFQEDNALLISTPEVSAFWFWAYRGRLFMSTDDDDSDDVPRFADAALQREAHVMANRGVAQRDGLNALAQARARFS